MGITRKKQATVLVLEVAGRLDAEWSETLRAGLQEAIHTGEHVIDLDFSRLEYISSAGLRVLLTMRKTLHAIHGRLGLRNPSPAVGRILELSGLGGLLSLQADSGTPIPGAKSVVFESGSLQVLSTNPEAFLRVRTIGKPGEYAPAHGASERFDANSVALGIGAFADDPGTAAGHMGELLAVGGCAAVQSVEGLGRPDYLITEQHLVPSAWTVSAILGRGDFAISGRFEAGTPTGSIALSTLCEKLLEVTGAPLIAFVLAAETAGLVGASLRAIPRANVETRFSVPDIRDWLHFSSEKAHRDSSTLVVGFASSGPGFLDPWLRPLDEKGPFPACHAHAAVFPYRPVQKGLLSLQPTVTSFFESQALTTVMHLINDTRHPGGSGDTEFLRGAFWAGPCVAEDAG